MLKVALLKDSRHLECDMSSRMQAQKELRCPQAADILILRTELF
jgi:hypothetical protein